jgi:hypothetical protein
MFLVASTNGFIRTPSTTYPNGSITSGPPRANLFPENSTMVERRDV